MLCQGGFMSLFAGNVSCLFQNCAEYEKHSFKCVFSAVRLKLQCKFVIMSVNFGFLLPCFRDFTLGQVCLLIVQKLS